MLDERGRHVLEPAADVLADRPHHPAAASARALGLRHLDPVHFPRHPARLPAGARRPPRPLRPRLGVLRVLDRPIELGVLPRLGLRITRCRWSFLSDQGLEQEHQLRGVDPLRLRAQALPTQLGDQELELPVLDEHRLERGEEELPGLLDLALREQRPCRLPDLPQGGQLAPGRGARRREGLSLTGPERHPSSGAAAAGAPAG